MKHLPLFLFFTTLVLLLSAHCLWAASGLEIVTTPANNADCLTLTDGKNEASVVVDDEDYAVVKIAANLFADDVQRVSGRRPVVTNSPAGASQIIIVGTLGHSPLIEKLTAKGELKSLDKIKGRWEATLWQMVEHPFPDVDRALVIVGSDRRGTAYGLTELSRKIGVSPWYWWADVPAEHHDVLVVKVPSPQTDSPAVKYRGFFINDEDWGLFPWASKTFDPKFGNIGPKTYEKVFELMLRLRLNYIWPAMHACTREFGSVPENYELAGRYGIVAGASHCEPMLYNNVKWNEQERGKWDYSVNRDAVRAVWEDSVRARGDEEAVWTLGIRGIHDRGMEGPRDTRERIKIVEKVISDQRALLDEYVTNEWGPVAQCFVPYKEVLPLYDAGLKVPEDVTLVWVDDNFGYLRRLSVPSERKRSGGAGVYWHLSYYGGPHSYTWINSTAPALLWEELEKAWENDARRLWVINVGDIKPMEIGIDYFSRLAWQPTAFGPDSQPLFLRAFAAKTFGEKLAQPIADLLGEFYHLGTIRKPELMDRAWALSLPEERAEQLRQGYEKLLDREKQLAAEIPPAARDAYTELVGFPVRVLGAGGLIFMADRKAQFGESKDANEAEVARLRHWLEGQVDDFNNEVANGKWRRMMPGLETANDLTRWNSQVRWPWGEPPDAAAGPKHPVRSNRVWRNAASADRQLASGTARWVEVQGLGPSGQAMALKPAGLSSTFGERADNTPVLEYDFETKAGDAMALIDFLPTFRLYPGMKLRVVVSVDYAAPVLVEVPGSSGAENENGAIRRSAVQDNYTRAQIPLTNLKAGKHLLKVRAVDPGAVIDAVSLP